MITFSKITTAIISGVVSISSMAADLRIISSGSKSGSYSMQAMAYSKDLANKYSVDVRVPGNYCEALKQIDDKTPTLFLWGHDFESDYRAGNCKGVKFKPAQNTAIRFDKNSSLVCSVKFNKTQFVSDGASGSIGHTVPKEQFTGPIVNINKKFNTNYSSVPYNGNGATRLALINGEIDYAMVTGEHAAFITGKGGSCFFLMDSPSKKYPDVASLQEVVGPLNVSHSFDTFLYAVNMPSTQKNELVADIRNAHKNCSSAIGRYTKCDTTIDFVWDISNVETSRWEADVNSLLGK